ncbi:MAG: GNAT family N-acetyltransferase [Candidatus Eisenbacteria bacterium]|uniref:GNAT family N-acetyltransferase n=1 Tax=Eiseniibacteriota bacterium TaxID=2212470 RepID=A0A956NG22_UNCEI|nr:GNAT family N-acetyltransferase [Candidatus Eisenbacteria bacterium]
MSPMGDSALEIRLLEPEQRDVALALRLHPHQLDWVPDVADSLALVDRHDNADPWLFWVGDVAVGFCAVTHGGATSSIGGFLVDRDHQGKGYGKAALALVVADTFRSQAKCDSILLTVREGNDPARQLYEGFGFVATERWHRGERIFSLTRAQARKALDRLQAKPKDATP